MFSQQQINDYYQALLNKDSQYEGVFFVGVKSTGIFCRPTCPAKKPKFCHCEFFSNRQEAILAGYRPCKRCRPLEHQSATTPLINQLVQLVEQEPTKKWQLQDLRDLNLDPSTVSRHFKKQFGMTFIEYSRARRIGIAMKHIRHGQAVIDSQIEAGYESASGFWDAFQKIMGTSPKQASSGLTLLAHWVDTPLGPMIVLANDDGIHLLEFVDRRGLENEIKKMRTQKGVRIIPGQHQHTQSITHELRNYFSGLQQAFTTPFVLHGSDFQKQVWQQLLRIPYGETISYKALAEQVGGANFARAVARANGSNQLALIIPCHRVINSNGDIGGYGGGVPRKLKLLALEKEAVT